MEFKLLDTFCIIFRTTWKIVTKLQETAKKNYKYLTVPLFAHSAHGGGDRHDGPHPRLLQPAALHGLGGGLHWGGGRGGGRHLGQQPHPAQQAGHGRDTQQLRLPAHPAQGESWGRHARLPPQRDRPGEGCHHVTASTPT